MMLDLPIDQPIVEFIALAVKRKNSYLEDYKLV